MPPIRHVVREALVGTLFRRNCVLPLATGRRFVFLFHDISPESEPHHHRNYSVSPGVFFRQIQVLRELFALVSLDTLCDRDNRSPSNQAAVVFDDGFLSVSTLAAPHLSAQGIPFAVFANQKALEEGRLWCSDVVLGLNDDQYLRSLYERYTDHGISYEIFAQAPLDHLISSPQLRDDYDGFGDRPPGAVRVYLNSAELQGLKRGGAVVGSHTVSHPVMERLSGVHAGTEIEQNKDYLESLLQAEIRHFAFPFGFPGTFNRETEALARSHHRFLYTTNRAFFKPTDLTMGGLLLPRIGLRNEGRPEILATVNAAFFVNRLNQIRMMN